MWKDPIVEELHKIRGQNAAKFDFNLLAMVKDYQKQEQQGGRKVASFVQRREPASVFAEKELMEA